MMFLALLTGLTFAGGNDATLARHLSKWTGAPTVLLADRRMRWRKTEIKAEDDKDRRRLVRTKFGLDVPLKTWGIAPSAWSRDYLNYINRPADFARATKSFEALERESKAGRITFVTGEIPAPIDQALSPRKELGKPVELDWTFKYAAVHIHARGVEERFYLQTLADSIGAKLIEKPSKFVFAFDPRAYRRRTIALLNAEIAALPDGWQRAQCQFDQAVLESLTDAQLTASMDERNLGKDVTHPASRSLLGAASYRLKWIFGNGSTPARSLNDASLASRFGGNVDFSMPVEVDWNPSGTASAVYRGEKNGKPLHVIP